MKKTNEALAYTLREIRIFAKPDIKDSKHI